MISLDQLLVLETIDRLGSFTAAGRALHRATSAISYSVKNLEEELGIELFDRSQHRAVLTEAGQVILSDAREILRGARALEQRAERLRGGWEAKLMFVVDSHVPMRPVMLATKRFSEQSDLTRLEVKVEGYQSSLERFVELDADILLTLGEIDDSELRSFPLPPLELLLVTGAQHPLATTERFLPEDLARHIEIRAADGPIRRPLSDSTFVLSDVRAQREALLEGVGFGWVPRHLVEEDIRSRRLKLVTFEEGFRERRIPKIVHKKGRAEGPAAQSLVETLKAEIDALVRGPRRRVRGYRRDS